MEDDGDRQRAIAARPEHSSAMHPIFPADAFAVSPLADHLVWKGERVKTSETIEPRALLERFLDCC